MSSDYVVCWIFLQTGKNDFYNHKQMTKQMTIFVIGSLMVNHVKMSVI